MEDEGEDFEDIFKQFSVTSLSMAAALQRIIMMSLERMLMRIVVDLEG